MIKNAIILSGGDGVRMRPLTRYIPKALVEVNDIPLIYNSIKLFKDFNIRNIYVTYGHLSEVLFNKLKYDVNGFINTSNEDNSYFLFNSFTKYINEPIIVIPCDLKIEIDLNKIYEDYLLLNEPAIMLIGTKPKHNIDGDYIKFNQENSITSIDRDLISDIYCSGLQIINPHKVNLLCKNKNNFYGVWEQLLGTDNLKVSNIQPTKWEAFDKIKQIL